MHERRRLPLLLALALALAGGCRGAAAPSASAGSCGPDRRLVLGACVPPAVAARFCGAAAQATLDGCRPRPPCEPGRARDLATGECLARRDVRTLASSVGILVAPDETLFCHDGGELAAGTVDVAPPGPRLGCLPGPGSPPASCPPGSLAEGAACRPLVSSRGVDVGTWVRTVLGPEGGPAAPPLCDALKRSPGALAVAVPVEVHVELSLVFPDNDVTQVSATVRGSGATTAELEAVVAPMVEALRNLGGTADQASIGTAVRCRRASERPSSRAPEPGPEGAGAPDPEMR